MPHLVGTFLGDGDPPIISHRNPDDGSINNLQQTSVFFRITDAGAGVDLDTLVIVITRGGDPPETAYDGGAGGFQTGYTGATISFGSYYEITVVPSAIFDPNITIQVDIDVDDHAGNSASDTYTFDVADSLPPFVTNQNPAPYAINVSRTGDIALRIDDLEDGVDLTTVIIRFSRDGDPPVTVYDGGGGGFQTGYDGPSSSATPASNGFDFVIDPTSTLLGTTIYVLVEATDLSPLTNTGEEEYTFQLEPVVGVKPVCSLAECRIASILGSIIQLDGRSSYSPDGNPVTFEWRFLQVPKGSIFEPDLNAVNPPSIKDLRPSSYAAISFVPDKLGDYVVQLQVFNDEVPSDGCTALIEIGLSRALCGSGKVPDASFVWSFLSNFWDLVEDRQYFETIWSGQLQLLGAEFIKLWSNDYNKSLDTIQTTVQRRWQRFLLHTDLGDRSQRVIVGNTKVGANGSTGEIGAPGPGDTNILHVLLANNDFTTIDVNYGAKGRIIDINGEAFTIDRVFNTTVSAVNYSVVVVDEEAVTDSQSNIPYRIPHLIHTPLFDLEDLGVRAGDVLVLEWTRGDTGLTAEMRVRVLAVDRERLGFEFTDEVLAPGDPTIKYALFEQLVRDLKIVSPLATETEIAAAANAVIAFIPTGINLSTRPFSVFQITVKAGKIIHNKARKVNELYVSIPHLQEEIRDDPPVILRENFDYVLEGGYLQFTAGLFTVDSPAPEELWAECTHVDNTPFIEDNFGRLVDLKHDDLVEKATRAPYLAAVKGLWFALTDKPSVANIRLGLQILMGLPFSEARGKILDITHNFSTDSFAQPIGRILAEDVDDEGRNLGIRRFYFFPENVGIEDNPLTGAPFAVGETVEAFQPLSKGIEVTDYVKDPEWWIRTLIGAEIRKFFLFKAQIDTDSGVFNENDLVFSLEFIRKIKPVYTNVVAAVLRSLSDDVMGDFTEEIVDSNILLRFYEDAGAYGGHESTVRSNDLNQQGVVLWRGDSRPFSTRNAFTLRDVITSQNGSAVEADSATGFGSARARVTGDADTPTVLGDILYIHPGQPGSGALTPRLYELTSVTLPNGPLVLGNEVSTADPTSLALNAPNANLFPYGSAITASVLRRAINPVVQGTNLQTTAGAIQLAASSGATLITDGVQIDDHLVIESGANAGEYRITSIVAQTVPRDYSPTGVPQISQTQVGLVTLNGTNPALADLSSQVFRIIKPHMMRTRVENAQIMQSGGNMFAEVLDAASSIPFDIFTPGMVGQELLVENAQNPLNNGVYTILQYMHAGRVRITTGSPQTSDASPTATLTIRSAHHSGFERAEELAPTEVFSAVVT